MTYSKVLHALRDAVGQAPNGGREWKREWAPAGDGPGLFNHSAGVVTLPPEAEAFVRKLGVKVEWSDTVETPRYVGGDTVVMPSPWRWTDGKAMARSLFHEVGHWTGWPERLGRASFQWGSILQPAYAEEEVVAETFAYLVAEKLGYADAAASGYYVANWMLVPNFDVEHGYKSAVEAFKKYGLPNLT